MNSANDYTHETIWARRQYRAGESGGDIAPKLAQRLADDYGLPLDRACELADEITTKAIRIEKEGE